MERLIKELFEKDCETAIEKDRKERTLDILRAAAMEKKTVYRPSFLQSLSGQLKYVHAGIFIGQLVCMGVMPVLVLYFINSGATRYDCLTLLSAFAAFIGVFMMVEFNRNFTCHLWELEQSCYFNLKQICASRLLLFGGMDLLMLTLLSGIAGRGAGIGYLRFGIYVLVPFVISQAVNLAVFSWLRNTEKEYAQYGLSFLSALLSVFASRFPQIYERTNLWLWCLLLFVAAIGLFLETAKILKDMEGDSVCWN